MFLLWASGAWAESVVTKEFTVTTLAPGVFTIQHPDPTDDFVDGNTTVVVGTRGVLVVDSCYLPSSAQRDLAVIKRLTNKPVRYVVNTHWHNDHNGGNRVYVDAYPSVDIVAHRETREMMNLRIRSYVARYTADDSTFGQARAAKRRLVETGLDADGKRVTPEERAKAKGSLAQADNAVSEFKKYVYQPPTLTFDHELTVDLGEREVRLMHLGRGNTGGDVVVYLPNEKLVATGDLFDRPVPYFFDGYPTEHLATLAALSQLDADTWVPGHGAVAHDKKALSREMELLRLVVTEVNRLVAAKGSGATLDEVTHAIDLKRFRDEMATDDDSREFFDASMSSLLELTYNEVKQR